MCKGFEPYPQTLFGISFTPCKGFNFAYYGSVCQPIHLTTYST